ncbi:MAG: hypothetical protein HEQ13_14660 [Dolichospermum sp. DEX189]|nr:hypothetical protein [Dolichospermum sp. DEX189]
MGDFTFLYTDWFYCVHLLTSLIYNMLHQPKRCLENRIKYHRGMWNVDGL